MSSGLIGAPETRWVIYINDPRGHRIAEAVDFTSLDGAIGLGGVGAVNLNFPLDISNTLLQQDHILELWRVPLNGRPYLFADRLWWMRDFEEGQENGADFRRVVAYDQNFIFSSPDGQKGRIIAYDESEAQTAKLDNISDMMKAYVRENVGSLASDTARSLATYLSVAPDNGQGPVGHSSGTSRRNLSTVLNELVAMAASLGTYLAWDIVCTNPPDATRPDPKFMLEFRTYQGQRGQDHRAGSQKPVLIGPDFGNLRNWRLTKETANEVTYVYARGEGIGTAAAISEDGDDARMRVSPFNRREFLVDSQAEDADGLADERDAALRAGRPREVLVGDLQETDDFRFDVHFGYGDYVTGQARGRSFDCRLDALRFQYTRNEAETITVQLRADNV